MRVKIVTTIRLILTAALLFGVYRETGPCTVITLTLIAIGLELRSWIAQR